MYASGDLVLREPRLNRQQEMRAISARSRCPEKRLTLSARFYTKKANLTGTH